MKTRMKSDLLQGLLAYPVPVNNAPDRKIRDIKPVGVKFFQRIKDQASKPSRISRRKVTMIEPRIIRPDAQESLWQNLRREKNI